MNWHPASVVKRADAGQGLTHLTLEVPAAVAATFVLPGQWAQLRVPHVGTGTFALASVPGAAPFEFLVKLGTRVPDALLDPAVSVELSDVGGPGFPLDRARGRPLLLVASGTGIAPMRSVINTLRRERAAFGPVTLLWGVRSQSHVPFTGELHAWEHDHVRVLTAHSQPHHGWAGRHGYVQDHLPDGPLGDAVAFLVGQKAMTVAVRAALLQRGLGAEHVFLNV